MPSLLSLQMPVGIGQANDPDDVERFDTALRDIGAYAPPDEYAAAPQRYATEPMIAATEKFQEQNSLKVDGLANPGGPTERAINNRLLGKPRGAGLLLEPMRPLRGTVGNGFANDRGDVQNVQRAFGALGYLPEDPHDKPHGFIDEATTKAATQFQRDHGLTPDGWMAPGGETERTMHEALNDQAARNRSAWSEYWNRERDAIDAAKIGATDGAGVTSEDLGGGGDAARRGSGRDGEGTRGGLWVEQIPRNILEMLPRRIPARRITYKPSERRSRVPGTQYFVNPGERLPPGAIDQEPPNADPVPWHFEPPRMERLKEWMREAEEGDPVANYRYFPPLTQPWRRGDPVPGTIVVTPPPGNEFAIPLIRAARQYHGRSGSDETRNATRDFTEEVIEACRKVMPNAERIHLGGPNPWDDDKGEILTSKDKRDAQRLGIILSNLGGSFGDATVHFRYRGTDVIFQFDTYTAKKSDRQPIRREERQFARLEYNEGDRNAVLARLPKPFEGEEIDRDALHELALRLCRKVKDAVDKGEMSKDENGTKKQIKEMFDQVIKESEKQKQKPLRRRSG